jgi:glycosyltransferase involved in cell wall biosynthesis
MLTLVPGTMGGSETYARELLRELSARDLDVSTLVAPVGAGSSGELRERVVPEYPTGPSTAARSRALLLGAARRGRLAAYLEGADVVHYPFTVGMPPAGGDQRRVVSLLDVQHHDLPQLFSRAERQYRRVTYDRGAARADAVVTISAFAKARIVDHLGIDPSRVHVAHLGVRPADFTGGDGGARGRFLFYPAKAWPHKNHGVLLDAFRILRARHPDLELVLTGAEPHELPSVPPGVRVLGHVPFARLVQLYGTAAALVFPSRYEGFGLPAVEAMSSGCPVAAARSGSLPEVVGDAGVLFDPDDAAAVAVGVEEALDRAAELRQLGQVRARSFTWQACADVHERLYRELGG